MIKIITNRNCVYQTAYHVIWCPKYRKCILEKDIAEYINVLLDEICIANKWVVLAKEIQPDHIHIFLSVSVGRSVGRSVSGESFKRCYCEKIVSTIPAFI